MSSTGGTTVTTRATPIDPASVAATIARLRAESEATESETTRAILLHEVGVLEELLGDEAAAARDQLGAVNAEPEFREPLERLIAIIERRQSYKNLGKLLERLVRVAESPEEKVRALLERALYQADHESDWPGARTSLEEATRAKSDDASLWLALEVVACQLEDTALRVRALAERADLTQHPTWRTLLLLDVAALLLDEGDVEGALNALDLAVKTKSPVTFLALVALEELGKREHRPDLLARSLRVQATLIHSSMEDAAVGDALGVQTWRRTVPQLTDTYLRAAEAERVSGNLQGAIELLDRALEQAPDEPAVTLARIAIADALGDTHTAAALARRQLNSGIDGGRAAALWLRVAEEAAAQGRVDGALEAVNAALQQDPGSIPAGALKLDLLLGGDQEPATLAAALEHTAAQLRDDAARARHFLLAADVWARRANDPQGAKVALSQAGACCAPPGTLARVSRMLADHTGHAGWFEEATRRLLAVGAQDTERAGLWFELVRAHLLRGDGPGAAEAAASLSQCTGGEWLGQVLGAYVLPLAQSDAQSGRATAALIGLAGLETEEDTARALRLAVAWRTLRAGEKAHAIEELEALHAADASDVVVAHQAAALHRSLGNDRRAAEVLSSTALATTDPTLGAAMLLEAGLLFWKGADRARAVEVFQTAASRAPASAGAALAWALKAAEPDDLSSRREALELPGATDDTGLAALERFALEAGHANNHADAEGALSRISGTDPDLDVAATIARSLWGDPSARDDQAAALDQLADTSPASRIVALSARFQLELEDHADPRVLERAVAAWAEADGSAHSALEWVGATIALEAPDREVAARNALAARLGPAGATVEASARIVGWLNGQDTLPPLSSDDPASRLVNLELGAPGSDPRRRAAALGGLGDLMGDESSALARAMAGWSQLALGEHQAAAQAFRSVTEAYPDELIGWEGLRCAAEALRDQQTVAEACAALGDIVTDDAAGAELWERAALILIDELGDPDRGEFALSRAIDRDIRRFVAFDRLFRAVRARKDHDRLLELVSRRLEVAEDPDEISKMFWERARVLRQTDRLDEALAALDNVNLLEPDHVGALALSGEIYLKRGRFPEAADRLGRLSALDEAPREQRLMSGVAAVDIFENKLGDSQKALAVLEGLYRAGLSTLPVRERLAKTSARVGAWDLTTEVLEALMLERKTSAGQVEAARLAMVIHRDRRGSPSQAEPATRKLLAELPGDGEALDLVLSGVFDQSITDSLLQSGQAALVDQLTADPLQPEQVDRLARIAAALENAPLRQAALGALVALGEGTLEIDQELRVLDERVAHVPQIAIDDSAVPELCDPEETGPLVELMKAVAPTLAEALGPGLQALGISKKHRVDPRAGLPLRNEVAAWAGALGVGDIDLYYGGTDDRGVFAVPTERPALVVGGSITAPLAPAYRQAVARELFALRRGTSILRHREPADVAAIVVAICRLAGVELPSPQYAMLAEFERLINKELPRRVVRRVLPELAGQVAAQGADPLRWVGGAVSSLDRLAAVAAGDVSHVLASTSGMRGKMGASIEAQQRAARLLAFVLSPTYLSVREQLGMGVR